MIGPSRMTYDIAASRHQQHLDHAARIREVQQARSDGSPQVHRPTQRRLTSMRISAVLSVAKAAFHL